MNKVCNYILLLAIAVTGSGKPARAQQGQGSKAVLATQAAQATQTGLADSNRVRQAQPTQPAQQTPQTQIAQADSTLIQTQNPGTFTNPILPAGADPWVTYRKGYYYYTNSQGNRLTIWKTRNIARLAFAEKKIVWVPDSGKVWSKELWAPELHYLAGKWYMYFAADDGKNQNHRIYVIENASADPTQGNWTFKGRLADAANKWAIDASVFSNHNQLYMIWSGWQADTNGRQSIYIAKLRNPYTLEGKRVLLSTPQYAWEEHGDLHDASNPPHVNVNEGPEILKHGKKIFLIYSASGCWTDFYELGMLTAEANANLMNPRSWKKSPRPVFTGSKENSVYSPGHNSFFKSPDGKQDWILYHANPGPGCGCDGKRSPRMQPFTWKKDGTPNFGIPVSTHTVLSIPSAN